MRKHAQSWMIKAALRAVVVVCIFWGIWSPQEGRQRELVKIRNFIITVVEARTYFQNLRDRYQSIYGERFTEEIAKKLNLKERALKDLVHRVLLLQEARRLGLKVTEEEVEFIIHSNPAFQKDGLFDKATDTRVHAEAHVGLARLHMLEERDWSAAERDVEHALASDPNSAVAFVQMSWLRLAFGDLGEAERYAKLAVSRDPQDPGFKGHLADIYYASGQFDEAERVVRSVLDQQPDRPGAYLRLSKILLAQRKARGCTGSAPARKQRGCSK